MQICSKVRFLLYGVLMSGLLLSQGCLSYTKGAGAKLDFDKIYVAPVKNNSFAPQAQALLTRQVREKLSNHPGLQLANSPDGAAELEIVIVKFGQRAASTWGRDSALAKSLDVKMTVVCSLKDNATGKIYFKNLKLFDSVECYANHHSHLSKFQAMPRLTRQIATKICEAVCKPW